MKIEFTQRFRKEYDLLEDKSILAESLLSFIGFVSGAKNLSEIKNMKKLRGFKDYYRIRLGGVKIGIKVVNHVIVLAVFEQKKDLSKIFL